MNNKKSFLDLDLGKMSADAVSVSVKIEALAFKARMGHFETDSQFVEELNKLIDELKRITCEFK